MAEVKLEELWEPEVNHRDHSLPRVEPELRGVQSQSEAGPGLKEEPEEVEIKVEPLEFPLIPESVKSEEEEPESSLLHQTVKEESREDADGAGAALDKHPESEEHSENSSDTDDSEDWTPSAQRPTAQTEECCSSDSEWSWEFNPPTKTPARSKRPMGDQYSDLTASDERPTAPTEECCSSDSGTKQPIEDLPDADDPQNKEHKCPECGKVLKSSENLRKHQLIHTNLKCPVCKKICKSMKLLKKHEKCHTVARPFKCSVCDKCFATKRNVKRHMKGHTERSFRCPVCFKDFCSRVMLKRHMKSHSGEKPFSCPICSKGFFSANLLKVHLMKKEDLSPAPLLEGPKPFRCAVCNRCYANERSLNRHHSLHFEQLTCPICAKVFETQGYLIQHMIMHSGEKPFKCKHCQKAFACKSSLRSHTRKHAFTCSVCKKAFKQRQSLKQHFLIHSGETPFKCKVCNKGFTGTSKLSWHMKKHTGEKPFACSVCKKAFARIGCRNKHMRLHSEKPFSCSMCEKGFSVKRRLDIHCRIHHRKKPPRSTVGACKTSVDVNSMMMNNSGVNPFVCPICGETFAFRRSINNHMKMHETENLPDLSPPKPSLIQNFKVEEAFELHTESTLVVESN